MTPVPPNYQADSLLLLVASAGGHVQQLHHLQQWTITGSERLWVTYDREQTASLLAGQRVIHAHSPTTRNVPNAVRNYRLARQVFRDHHIEMVISTGAGVAVPFMVRARQLGVPCHYIESATRVDGPSLSGRLLQRLRGVHLYRQLGEWGEPRWQAGPCVFDGYTVGPAKPRSPKRVVVSLGTHNFHFTTLVERLASCLQGGDVEVLWQLGSTPDPGDLPGQVVDLLPSDELEAAIVDADVVVGHAGVGLTLTALRAGTVPVLSPRRRDRQEHADNHQVQLARELSRRGLAVAAEVEELSRQHLVEATRHTVTFDPPGPVDFIAGSPS